MTKYDNIGFLEKNRVSKTFELAIVNEPSVFELLRVDGTSVSPFYFLRP